MGAEGIIARYPQFSTHKISLGLLARYIADRLRCRVWLLGVEPRDTGFGRTLSPAVEETMSLLLEQFREVQRVHAG